MHYYYVRYNVYDNVKPPEEKETWLKFQEHHDDQEMKLYLSVRHNAAVSVISSVPLDEEQYDNQETERY